MSYASQVLADGASHYWRLGEPSGTTAVDLIGGTNGTISGGVTLNQPGALADGTPAMLFNGTTGVVDLGKPAALNLPGTITVELWLSPTLAGRWPCGDLDSTGGIAQYAILHTAGGNIRWFHSHTDASNLTYNAGSVLTLSAWTHSVFVRNDAAKTVTYYQNGLVDPGGSLSYAGKTVISDATAGNKAIGRGGSYAGVTSWFSGGLDEVAIYPVALTPAQIAAHYALRTDTGGGAGPVPWGALVLNAFD